MQLDDDQANCRRAGIHLCIRFNDYQLIKI